MFENCKEKKCWPLLGAIIGIFLVVLTIGKLVDIQDKVQTSKNTITVSGNGEIFAKPDLVLTTFSVITEAKTAATALSQNSEKMNSVINFIKSQGVADKDLKTVSFNIFPRYEFTDKDGKRVLVGYEAQQSLQVKIRDMKNIGAIIEGAANSGANQAGDLQFTVEKGDELKSQARKQAIDQARAKAEELASQLEVRLGKVTNFSESGNVPIFFGLEKAMAPQIEIGENKIEVTVSITYEIR